MPIWGGNPDFTELSPLEKLRQRWLNFTHDGDSCDYVEALEQELLRLKSDPRILLTGADWIELGIAYQENPTTRKELLDAIGEAYFLAIGAPIPKEAE